MSESIRREIVFPQSREVVWRALTDSAALAGWLMPNDFEPRVGHRFTFRTQPNPQAGFDGISKACTWETSGTSAGAERYLRFLNNEPQNPRGLSGSSSGGGGGASGSCWICGSLGGGFARIVARGTVSVGVPMPGTV